MKDLLASRSARDLDMGTLSWLVAVNDQGLGLEDCGCGQPVTSRIIRIEPLYGAPTVVSVVFFHGGSNRCQLAFDFRTFKPLGYQEYCKLVGIEPEYYDDGEVI